MGMPPRTLAVVLVVALAACGTEPAARRGALATAPPDPTSAAPGDSNAAVGASASSNASSAPPESVATFAPAEPAPAVVERIAIEGDEPVSFVRAPDGSTPRIVFLAGVCTIGYAYLARFPEAARAHGGGIALEGDQPCAGYPDYRTFSGDGDKQEKRVEAALDALMGGSASPPKDGFTLVGYSRGAILAERMSHKWPDRYPRVIVIGSPTDPNAAMLAGAKAVVTMSCSKDVPWRMKGALGGFSYRKIQAAYFEMPDCTHGQVADAERVFGEAFTWLEEHQNMPM